MLDMMKNLMKFKMNFYNKLKLTLDIDEYNDNGFKHYKLEVLKNVD
jgi:hypothetical protein